MATPMKSSAADHSRPTRWDLLVVALVLALAALLTWLVLPSPGQTGAVATVTLDAQVIATVPLSGSQDAQVPTQLSLEECPYPLVLEYHQGAIRVVESQCPGADCLHTGWISQPGQQIICLPNRLIISIDGQPSLPFDAISG